MSFSTFLVINNWWFALLATIGKWVIARTWVNLEISLFRVQASSKQYVYLGGDSIGLKMNTGVYVVGKYEVQTKRGRVSPWQNSNIDVGDTIEK